MDIVLEAPGGRIVGLEVKAASAVGPGDFAGLHALADAAGRKFVRGVVLFLGEQVVPFCKGMWAVPVGDLWSPAE